MNNSQQIELHLNWIQHDRNSFNRLRSKLTTNLSGIMIESFTNFKDHWIIKAAIVH